MRTIAGLLLLAFLTVTCPIDRSSAYFTGNTQVAENGALLHEYSCTAYAHHFWVR